MEAVAAGAAGEAVAASAATGISAAAQAAATAPVRRLGERVGRCMAAPFGRWSRTHALHMTVWLASVATSMGRPPHPGSNPAGPPVIMTSVRTHLHQGHDQVAGGLGAPRRFSRDHDLVYTWLCQCHDHGMKAGSGLAAQSRAGAAVAGPGSPMPGGLGEATAASGRRPGPCC